MATSLTLFDSFKSTISGKINLSTDTIKVGLATSAQTLSASGQAVYADITAELPTANGYTSGGVAVTSRTWAQTAGTAKLDFADVSWSIVTGSITARYFFIYSDTATNKDLIGFGFLDATPTDVTVPANVILSLVINDNGLLTLS